MMMIGLPIFFEELPPTDVTLTDSAEEEEGNNKPEVIQDVKKSTSAEEADPEQIHDAKKEEPASSETLYAAEVEKIIARYIVDAPCNEVRDVLRLYSLKKTYKQQKASFSTHSKTDIIKTLGFLGDYT